MEPERSLSNVSASVSLSYSRRKDKKPQELKNSVESSGKIIMNKDVVQSHLEIQTLREDPTRIETMTVLELRTMMRTMGVPAKGSKRDLVSAMKCFLVSREEGESPLAADKDATPVIKETARQKRKADSSSGEDNSLSSNALAKVSKTIQKRNRGKLDLNPGSKSIEVPVEQKQKQKLAVETVEILDTKSSHAKRKTSLKIDKEGCEFANGIGGAPKFNEPWTVLAHKKPQPGWVPYNPRVMRPPPLLNDTKSMKLISWNVNGLRALLKLEGFSALEFAQKEKFDVLCLQETKLQEKDVEGIKESLIDGYSNSFWTCSLSKLGYSGTAIISRIKPLFVKYGLGILDHDSEGRLVTVEFDTFYLLNAYVPNSGDGLKRLSYRVGEWDPSLSNYMKDLEKSKPVILTGDLNCAHQEIDIFNPAGNRRSAGFTAEERESFGANFLSNGFVDTFRKQHPGVVGYTYWGYRHSGRATNNGWRLDYFLVSEAIADNVHDSYILPEVGGSDHCPIGLILKL